MSRSRPVLLRQSFLGLWLVALFSVSAGADGVPLRDLVKNRNTAGVRALLQRKVDVNAVATDGTTALHWAVQDEQGEIVDLLLRAGASATIATRHGVTPLSLACINGNASIIRQLLVAGADANTALPEGETALMTAAKTGSVGAVTMLLDHGAKVRAQENWRGQDALMWASAEGHREVVQLLLARGADANASSASGYTALMFATRANHPEVVKILLAAGANLNATTTEDAGGASPLIFAIYNAEWDLAADLLERGADPNVSTPGYTPLHLALQVRNPDVDRNPDEVQTARAATNRRLDSIDVIKLLLKKGANPSARMTKGFVRLGSPPDMPILGATPFFLAAKGADPIVMRLLLEAGADALTPTLAGSTPLMAAAGVGYQQGRSTGTEAEALEAVKLAVERGADVNAANNNGFTALHGAVIRGANSVVEYLVTSGANPQAADKRNRTPLKIAEEGAGDSQQRRQLHTAAFLRELTTARP